MHFLLRMSTQILVLMQNINIKLHRILILLKYLTCYLKNHTLLIIINLTRLIFNETNELRIVDFLKQLKAVFIKQRNYFEYLLLHLTIIFLFSI